MFLIRFEIFSSFVFISHFVATRGQHIDQQPPSFFETSPKLLYFKERGDVTLECKATGSPEVTFRWIKNGVQIRTEVSNVHQKDGSLRISSASQSDEGFYQCIAENKYGIAFTNVTELKKSVLQSIGPSLLTNEMVATEGQPFKIPASSFKSIPLPRSFDNHVWLKKAGNTNESPEGVVLGKRIQVADNGDLHFAYAMTTDDLSGKSYLHALKNSFTQTTVEGNYTKITVNTNAQAGNGFSPSLAFSSDSRSVAFEGENVTFRCFFYGKPEPIVTWLRSVDSLPADRFTLSNHDTQLTLINVSKSDETLYHCFGRNSQGSLMHNISLQVQASPRFIKANDAPNDVYIIEKDNVTFNCNASAEPEPDITWYFNGKSLNELSRDRFHISDDRTSLTINSVCRECKGQDGQMTSDTGVIQCNASNVHGYTVGTGFLSVITLKQAASLNTATVERPIPFEYAFLFILTTSILICF